MTILEFPPVETADEDGLLAVGGDVDVDSLILGYRRGIFLWPISEGLLTWFAPPQRGILFFDDFHLSRTYKKQIKKLNYEVRIDTCFEQVIKACSEPTNRGKQNGTWITSDILTGFINLHKAGFAHSFECFEDGNLVGGIYGVCIGSYFSAESMFYRKPYASLKALSELVAHLRKQGVSWIDCQVSSRFINTLGVIDVNRSEFMEMLKISIGRPALGFDI